jgi:hexosaminidase
MTATSNAAAIPNTIPAVQSWTTGTGTCVFSTTSRIVVNTADAAALTADANTFAQDLNGLLSRAVTVVSAASANAGDIFLHLGATDTTIGTEGYIMTIATTIDISARAAAGIFYGTRTAMQMLKQSATVNQGTIKDWPLGKWRGQMMDVGRKYYTVAWLQTLIRDLAYVKMNMLHLHLADGLSATNNGGFRLQCTSHPEITSTQYYTTAQMQGFITLAAKYHITIVPEIDLPGHVNWLYANHQNLLLNQQVLGTQYWALDLSKDTVYSFVKSLLNEFIPLFPGPYWHIGADEYMFIDEYANFPQLTTWAKAKFGSNAHANDCYRYFANWADSIVKSKGKIMMAWNDVLLGLAATSGAGVDTVAKDIHMDFWGCLSWIGWNGTYPSLPDGRGQMMMNTAWSIFYVIGKSLGIGDPTWVYNSWELYTFDGGNLPANDSHILGGKVPIWGDIPDAETEASVWTNTFQLNRAVAQKVWGSAKIQATAPNFQTMATTIGRAPVPVVSVKDVLVKPVRAFGKIESVQIFDLRGVLVKALTGTAFNAGNKLENAYKFVNSDRALTTGPYLFRFKDSDGFEKTEVIMLVR